MLGLNIHSIDKWSKNSQNVHSLSSLEAHKYMATQGHASEQPRLYVIALSLSIVYAYTQSKHTPSQDFDLHGQLLKL